MTTTLMASRKLFDAATMPPSEAVRWLLAFAALDLDEVRALSPARLEELTAGAHRFTDGVVPQTRMRPNTLGALWIVAHKGLRDYFEGRRAWEFTVKMFGAVFRGKDGRPLLHPLVEGNEVQRFSWRVAQAVHAVGPRLRECADPECRRAFLAERRQTHCTRRCSDRVRLARFRGKLAQDSDKRDTYNYRRKLARVRREDRKEQQHQRQRKGQGKEG